MCLHGEYGICQLCPQEDCPDDLRKNEKCSDMLDCSEEVDEEDEGSLFYDEDDDEVYEVIPFSCFSDWCFDDKNKLKPYKRIALNDSGIVYGFLHLCRFIGGRNIAIETSQYIDNIFSYINS